jgi:hypothetical protein
MNIEIIKCLVEDVSRFENGVVNEDFLLPWVHPAEVSGLNKKELRKENEKKHRSLKYCDDFNDNILADYLYQCKTQRTWHCTTNKTTTHLVSELDFVFAVLHLSETYWTIPDSTSVVHSDLSFDEYKLILDEIIAVLARMTKASAKDVIVQYAHMIFCYKHISPNLDDIPELKHFLSISKNIRSIESLHTM